MPYNYSSSQSGTQTIPGMMGVYNQTLGLNQANYSNILGAYGQGQQNLSATLPGIYGGYGQLGGQVAETLGYGGTPWGVAAPAAQAIARTFAQEQGQTTQGMINAGLGNTTVLPNLQNQNAMMAEQAYGGLGAQLAQTYAGYEANIGMAGLGARMQGLGMQNQMTQALGGTLGGQKFGNTAGNLTGGFGSSMGIGGGGGIGGSMGGGILNEPDLGYMSSGAAYDPTSGWVAGQSDTGYGAAGGGSAIYPGGTAGGAGLVDTSAYESYDPSLEAGSAYSDTSFSPWS